MGFCNYFVKGLFSLSVIIDTSALMVYRHFVNSHLSRMTKDKFSHKSHENGKEGM